VYCENVLEGQLKGVSPLSWCHCPPIRDLKVVLPVMNQNPSGGDVLRTHVVAYLLICYEIRTCSVMFQRTCH